MDARANFVGAGGAQSAACDRIIDRGLFLVLIGHPLFMVSYFFAEKSSVSGILHRGFVTDVIGTLESGISGQRCRHMRREISPCSTLTPFRNPLI